MVFLKFLEFFKRGNNWPNKMKKIKAPLNFFLFPIGALCDTFVPFVFNFFTTRGRKGVTRSTKIFYLICSFLILITSCSNDDNKQPASTPTSGAVRIDVDESYSLLFDTEIFTFESLYKRAKIFVQYKSETDALNDLIKDSCKVVVTNRVLTEAEKKQFAAAKIFPRTTKVAEDAVALIVNNENPDTLISADKLREILLGHDSLWKQISSKSKLAIINVVFDNNNSANARYMRDSIIKGEKFQKNCFALKSNPDVIDYVSRNKNALGIISVNWISDRDDTLSRHFLRKIKVMGVSKSESSGHYKPYQSYIKTKDYPFCRDVYMINRQTRAGLGMGFVSFVAGDKGQRIILKAGLIPAVAPVRIVNIR